MRGKLPRLHLSGGNLIKSQRKPLSLVPHSAMAKNVRFDLSVPVAFAKTVEPIGVVVSCHITTRAVVNDFHLPLFARAQVAFRAEEEEPQSLYALVTSLHHVVSPPLVVSLRYVSWVVVT